MGGVWCVVCVPLRIIEAIKIVRPVRGRTRKIEGQKKTISISISTLRATMHGPMRIDDTLVQGPRGKRANKDAYLRCNNTTT